MGTAVRSYGRRRAAIGMVRRAETDWRRYRRTALIRQRTRDARWRSLRTNATPRSAPERSERSSPPSARAHRCHHDVARDSTDPSDGTQADPQGSYDVLVIGAGQAGLTVGYYLRQAGVRFLIVDAADQVGSAWGKRWDSLVLFTPRRYNAMPGLSFNGDPDQEPTRDEVIAYLDRYATELDLPVELTAGSSRLDHRQGRYAAELPSADDPRRPSRRRHRPVPAAVDSLVCRLGRLGRLSDSQHRLPPTERPSAGTGRRRRGR